MLNIEINSRVKIPRKNKQLPSLVGERFGRLTVVEFIEVKNGARYWKCLCDCGKEKNLPTERLTSKRNGSKSCGCLVADSSKYRKPRFDALLPGESTFNEIYGAYRNSAIRRGIEFLIEKAHFKELVTGNCFYCGVEPSTTKIVKHNKGSFTYNGIDRIDSGRGYVEGNILTCCKICNYAKHTLSFDEFMGYLYRVARKYKDV